MRSTPRAISTFSLAWPGRKKLELGKEILAEQDDSDIKQEPEQ
jgi:hypothetical protein